MDKSMLQAQAQQAGAEKARAPQTISNPIPNIEQVAQICIAWQLGFAAAGELRVYSRYGITYDTLDYLLLFRGKQSELKNFDGHGEQLLHRIFDALKPLLQSER